eukprot:764296-Hanusia_phi.AAC.4
MERSSLERKGGIMAHLSGSNLSCILEGRARYEEREIAEVKAPYRDKLVVILDSSEKFCNWREREILQVEDISEIPCCLCASLTCEIPGGYQ